MQNDAIRMGETSESAYAKVRIRSRDCKAAAPLFHPIGAERDGPILLQN